MSRKRSSHKRILYVILIACSVLFLASCGEQAASSSATPEEVQEEYQKVANGTGVVNGFIGEKFYDGKITNGDEAYKAAVSVIERVGGDKTTKLELMAVRPVEGGNTYYIFRQRAGDLLVHGASVKLIVNKDGEAIGLVSAVMPNIHLDDIQQMGITKEQAEQVVLDQCKSQGVDSVEIEKGASEQTVIPVESGNSTYCYAWAVYTNNYDEHLHTDYLVHYVDVDGKYMYALGISEPHSSEALSGEAAAFEFDSMEQGTWTGTVRKHDGSTKEVTVPTLKDRETGDVYLADGKRKILCTDYAKCEYEGTISPRIQTDGTFANNELLIYDTFIRVWDFYDKIGWKGPDDEGTPCIILMDMVEQSGEVIHNAYYAGRQNGFQRFMFNREDTDGECTDVIAHEFTHCVTATAMTSSLFINDLGAINEGMSDICGNLIEMLIDYNEAGAWLIGENEASGVPYRSMKEPHAYSQPEFVWDIYYGGAVAQGTADNDYGGVHTNSSLLNFISYKLYQAGMQPDEQFFYWMNVALAMTPLTDYPQMTELLPWCLEQTGNGKYADALNKAIEQGRLTQKEPAELPEGAGMLNVKIPESALAGSENMQFSIRPAGGEGAPINAWVASATGSVMSALPAGDYYIGVALTAEDGSIVIKDYAGDKWVERTDEQAEGAATFTIKAGETLDLTTEGLVS